MDAYSFSESVIQRVAETKIRAAREAGKFDNLPGLGRPFEFDELSYDPHWWVRRKLAREDLIIRAGRLACRDRASS